MAAQTVTDLGRKLIAFVDNTHVHIVNFQATRLGDFYRAFLMIKYLEFILL